MGQFITYSFRVKRRPDRACQGRETEQDRFSSHQKAFQESPSWVRRSRARRTAPATCEPRYRCRVENEIRAWSCVSHRFRVTWPESGQTRFAAKVQAIRVLCSFENAHPRKSHVQKIYPALFPFDAFRFNGHRKDRRNRLVPNQQLGLPNRRPSADAISVRSGGKSEIQTLRR